MPPALPAAVSGVGGARAEARRRSSSSPTPFSGPARPAWLARRAQHVLRGQLAAPGPLRAGGHDEAAEVDRASTASRAPSELQRSGWRFWVGETPESAPREARVTRSQFGSIFSGNATSSWRVASSTAGRRARPHQRLLARSSAFSRPPRTALNYQHPRRVKKVWGVKHRTLRRIDEFVVTRMPRALTRSG